MPDQKRKTEVEPDGKTAAQKRVEILEAKVAELSEDLEARKAAQAELEKAELDAKEADKVLPEDDGWAEFLP